VEGKHLVPCHKFVLDACSDYFASFLKNKILDDKNLVICLPKEIKLWEVQALLQFMYHGEVCISQEGLSSLVKCAELLQVKGLCGNETTSIISKEKESSPTPKPKTSDDNSSESQHNDAIECISANGNNNTPEMIEIDVNEADTFVYNEQMIIKREVNISKLHSLLVELC
jgi:BTB/POZ domain